MKKFISIAMLLMLAASAQAAVTVSCARVGTTNDVEVSYTVTGPNSVRAFSLDISVDGGENNRSYLFELKLLYLPGVSPDFQRLGFELRKLRLQLDLCRN